MEEGYNNRINYFKKLSWLIPALIVSILLYALFIPDKSPTERSRVTLLTEAPLAKDKKDLITPKVVTSDTKSPIVLEENFKAPDVIENRLKQLPKVWQDMFRENMDLDFVEDLEKCTSLEEAVSIITAHADPNFKKEDLKNWLDECMKELSLLRWGGRSIHELPDIYQLRALASYLIDFQKFKYSKEMTPDLYLISNVVKKRAGYCSTLPVVYALLSERLGLPVYMVQAAGHMFNRYDNGIKKINIETTSPLGMGIGTPDDFYMNDSRTGHISKEFMEATSIMKSMNLRQSISALLINNMAALNDKDAFKSLMQSPLPKKSDNLKKSADYMLMALYFDKHSILPIVNVLNVLKWKSELYNNPDFFQSLRAYAVRKTILPLTKKDAQIIDKQMVYFVSNLNKFHSLVDEYQLMKLSRSRSGKHDGGTVETLQLDIIKTSNNNMNSIQGFLEANKFILPEKMKKDLLGMKQNYKNIKEKVISSL